MTGCNRIRTSAYYPASNGLLKRWHRPLKAAKCVTKKDLGGSRDSVWDDVTCWEVLSFFALSQFLENRIQALDAAHTNEQAPHSAPSKESKLKEKGALLRKGNASSFASTSKPSSTRKCPSCSGTR